MTAALTLIWSQAAVATGFTAPILRYFYSPDAILPPTETNTFYQSTKGISVIVSICFHCMFCTLHTQRQNVFLASTFLCQNSTF